MTGGVITCKWENKHVVERLPQRFVGKLLSSELSVWSKWLSQTFYCMLVGNWLTLCQWQKGNSCSQHTVPDWISVRYHHFFHLFYFSEWITPYREKHFVSDVPFIDSHCHLDFLFKRKNYTASLYGYLQAGGDKIATQTTPPNFAGCLAIFCDPVFWSQGWSNGVNFIWV